MRAISKKRIRCYPTSNPILQFKHHCQISEKNPNIGMVPLLLSLLARPHLALVRTTALPLCFISPISFPSCSSVTIYLHLQLKNEMGEHVESYVEIYKKKQAPFQALSFSSAFSFQQPLFILSLCPYKKKSR